MPTLLDAFDSYNDFNRSAYYILCFNTLPSNLTLEIPLKETKANMELAVATLDVEKLQLKPIFKNWRTEDDKDADVAQDYPFQYLFKSDALKLLIWISLNNNELYMDLHYDAETQELEQQVLALNHTFREKFGEKKAPTFKVLTHNDRFFSTEDVKCEFLQVDVAALYNDDFLEIHSLIEASLEQEKSGLILLHGAPGTGKTSYIKSLISKHPNSTFIFIQNEFVQDLLKPDFISFLLKNRNAILVIEDAEKVITTRESVQENSVVSTILQLTDGLFSDFLNIKVICTFNTTLDKVDKALLRKGRLIANYEFKPLEAKKATRLLETLGHQTPDTDLALADIFNFQEKAFTEASNKKKIGF
ncbi:AAA family ATPase [Rufibacter sp. LB8]|uniref:AAA family ATPase n=1 Tax=Rufibacter sp. LB8 TaxID=2777781 RepID=UPI00178C26F7|nr:AAA family ATPase [Rufibacter sp. LB8]